MDDKQHANAVKLTGCHLCSTQGLAGNGMQGAKAVKVDTIIGIQDNNPSVLRKTVNTIQFLKYPNYCASWFEAIPDFSSSIPFPFVINNLLI